MKGYLTVLFACLFIVSGCNGDQEKEAEPVVSEEHASPSLPFKGCQTCHGDLKHDQNHDLPCTKCHSGNSQGQTMEAAHAELITQPAHPDFMEQSCGGCHSGKVKQSRDSLHFTLENKTRMIQDHFGIQDVDTGLFSYSASPEPGSAKDLVYDMLRRRCTRCHMYYSGDTYANTQRGTGCAACHMAFNNGTLAGHEMLPVPGDLQCLSCHYGNFVGADFYGRYEHDFGNEYRTPFTTREEHFRPYGIEYHELVPDIHQQKGLSCVDCHTDHSSLEDTVSDRITCRTCHQVNQESTGKDTLPSNLAIENGVPVLAAKLTGNKHPVPQMTDPVHERYAHAVSCQVCHAQWSFNDTTTHLIRSDSDDFDPWASLVTQSSSEVENILFRNLYSDEEELPPSMTDTVTGKLLPGVWYKGFTERRWERMLIQRDTDGMIKVFRPILDLRLSYIDSDEDIIFDNLQGSGQALLPYTPHTTGKAGLFYLNRFAHLLESETSQVTEQ